jgi:CheY-like chemotaxis protein
MARSEVGRGSSFEFTAKLAAGSDIDGQVGLGDASCLKGKNILIVDDNDTNRKILTEVLESWGAQPTAVGSGPAAIRTLRAASGETARFDAAILDGMMPDMDGFELAEVIKANRKTADIPLIMLTSGPRSDGIKRSRETGLAAYLYKPVRQSELLAALTSILDHAPTAWTEGRIIESARVEQVKEAEAMKSIPARTLNVLLVEDHPVNQKLAVHLLKKQGHDVTVTANGREGVNALEADTFDLVLMDIQMPEMDGFEAVALIREREASTGAHIPILALTARAMKGDKERCLSSGFDGYVSKPIRADELSAAILEMTRRRVEDPRAAVLERLRDKSGLDEECLEELIDVFLESAPASVTAVEEALALDDAARLTESAHTLCGISLSIGAVELADATRVLEEAGRLGDIAWARQASAPFLAAWETLRQGLSREQAPMS